MLAYCTGHKNEMSKSIWMDVVVVVVAAAAVDIVVEIGGDGDDDDLFEIV